MKRLGLLAAALAAVVLVPTSSAFTARLGDAIGDSGAAADLMSGSVSYDNGDAELLILRVSGAGRIPDGGDVVIGFDTDRNPATGTDGGADYLLELVPGTKGFGVALSRWQ